MKGKKLWLCAVLAFFLFIMIFLTADGRTALHLWAFGLKKADDSSKYETLKTVEDSCRAMIASYTSDKLVYEQYKDSENEEKQSWAEQAKMRANKTAANYNEYILKNTFIWEGNIPDDIKNKLDYLE